MSYLTNLKIKGIKFFRKHFFFKKEPKEIFETIYSKNLWRSAESISGPGSELKSTIQLRKALAEFINRNSITIILDCGCGDFNWMKEIDLKNIQYLGIDIVEDLILKNSSNYAQPNIAFQEKNLITDNLPRVDLIMCRDVLVHLNNEEIKKVIENFKKTKSAYLLITSFSGTANKDSFTGDWRPINLQADPFNLPPPDEIIYEDTINSSVQKKQLCVWKQFNK